MVVSLRSLTPEQKQAEDQKNSDDSDDGDESEETTPEQDCANGNCDDGDEGGGDEGNPNPFDDFPSGCIFSPNCNDPEDGEDGVSNPWDFLGWVIDWGDGDGPGGPIENPGDTHGIDGGDVGPNGPGGPIANPGEIFGDWTDDLGDGGPVQRLLDTVGFEEDEGGNPIGPPQPQLGVGAP